MKVNIVNIGCFKNLVDCELLMWQLRSSGVVVEFGNTEVNADIVVINTCGFISDAETDSLNEIQKLVKLKRQGTIGQVWVMGCYGEKMKTDIVKNIPEVDRVYGNFNWHLIVKEICSQDWIKVTTELYQLPIITHILKFQMGAICLVLIA